MFYGLARYAFKRGLRKAQYQGRNRLWNYGRLGRSDTWYRRGNTMYQSHRDGIISRSMSRRQYLARRSAPHFASYGPAAYWEYRGFNRSRYNRNNTRYRTNYRRYY